MVGFRTSRITSLSNFSVAYNFQSISICLVIMSSTICTSSTSDCLLGVQADWVYSTSTAISFIGAIVGQISMGYLGDLIGRNKALIATMSLSAISALLSGLSSRGNAVSIYSLVIVFRFFLGIGLGGIFPLSATKASEDSSQSNLDANPVAASWAYFWQEPGSMVPWMLAYVLSSISTVSNDTQWRTILSVGCIPPLLTIYLLIMDEYENNTPVLRRDPATVSITCDNEDSPLLPTTPSTETLKPLNIYEALCDKTNVHSLLGSGGAWFAYDFFSYGVVLLGGKILDSILDPSDVSSSQNIQALCSRQLFAFLWAIPVTIGAIYMLPRLGLKWLQMASLMFSFVVFLVFASVYTSFANAGYTNGLYAMYCLALIASKTGINITSYSFPAALFKKEYRASLNGAAAALGKVGAIAGTLTLSFVGEASSYGTSMAICCVVAAAGGAMTYLFIDESIIQKSTGFKFQGLGGLRRSSERVHQTTGFSSI